MSTAGHLLGKTLILVLNNKLQRSKDLNVSSGGTLSMNMESVAMKCFLGTRLCFVFEP